MSKDKLYNIVLELCELLSKKQRELLINFLQAYDTF